MSKTTLKPCHAASLTFWTLVAGILVRDGWKPKKNRRAKSATTTGKTRKK
jgi:hypothetical protein